MTSMRVGSVQRRENADGTEAVWAEIRLGARRHQVRYRVRGARTSARADLFVPVALLPARRAGAGLELDDPISPRLLAATSDVQAVVGGWEGSVSRVPVTAAAAVPLTRASGVGCF